MKCAICSKDFKPHQKVAIREFWLQSGGFGSIPERAIVHVKCNTDEQHRIKMGVFTPPAAPSDCALQIGKRYTWLYGRHWHIIPVDALVVNISPRGAKALIQVQQADGRIVTQWVTIVVTHCYPIGSVYKPDKQRLRE